MHDPEWMGETMARLYAVGYFGSSGPPQPDGPVTAKLARQRQAREQELRDLASSPRAVRPATLPARASLPRARTDAPPDWLVAGSVLASGACLLAVVLAVVLTMVGYEPGWVEALGITSTIGAAFFLVMTIVLVNSD